MATEQTETYEATAKPRRSARPLLLVTLLLLSVAAGGAAGAMGLLAPLHGLVAGRGTAAPPPAPVFHALPEFRVAIGAPADGQTFAAATPGRHLRAVVHLEVEAARRAEVEALQPRIVDVLLAFLHALDERDVGGSRSLDRLKAQMLHRVRQVTGAGIVRGVLITEFALL